MQEILADPDIVLTAMAIIFLLAISAFFSGSETALTGASRARMHALAKVGKKGALRVNALIADPDRLIGSVLLGNNLVNITAAALATALTVRIVGEGGVAIATIAMTVLVLIFAEILPKTVAIHNADRTAMALSRPLKIAVWLLAPPARGLQLIVRAILLVFGLRARSAPLGDIEEIRGAIDMHAAAGVVESEERHRLGGILDLRDLSVADVMVHRKSIQMIDADLPTTEIVSQVLASSHTRLPLYRGDKEEIVGILHARDLLSAIAEAGGDFSSIDIHSLARRAWFAPETIPLQDQLDLFLKERNHLCLVVDEYGVLMGLLTLEDILEEIVGDIRDEHDKHVRGVVQQPDGSVMTDGTVTIRDLNRAMDWDLPDDEAVTVAGLVIHEAQSIPEPGRSFIFHGHMFTILGKSRNQITRLRIRRDG